MAVGLPVVATSLAAEGMSLTDGENILIADDPQAFADTVARLYLDEALWTRLSQAGIAFASQAWGAEAAWKTLAGILNDMGITNLRRNAHAIHLYQADSNGARLKGNGEMLCPVFIARTREDYEKGLTSKTFTEIETIESSLIDAARTDAFTVDGDCIPCGKKVSFLVDMQSGGQIIDGKRKPNWRERLVCPLCQMNNRQRLIAALIKQHLNGTQGKTVYFMEHVTPIFAWANNSFRQHRVIGSEYLGHEYESGQVIRGIRHEDIENMSFGDGELDLIVSNDVFEHVPHPERAFAECARVLKPGGIMLATIPFHRSSNVSVKRAEIIDGQLVHHLPPAYHGNPVSADGSLVFTDFGWDLLDEMKDAGFSDVAVEIYASPKYGHLGGGQMVFRLLR
jgi:hypothetical protein